MSGVHACAPPTSRGRRSRRSLHCAEAPPLAPPEKHPSSLASSQLAAHEQPSLPQRPAGLSCLTSRGRQAAAFPRRVGCPTAGGSQSNGAHALTARCTLLRPRQSSTILFLLTLKTFCDTHVLGLRRWRRGAPRARPLRELITRHPQYLKAPERYQGRTILLCKDVRRCSGWCASCRP